MRSHKTALGGFIRTNHHHIRNAFLITSPQVISVLVALFTLPATLNALLPKDYGLLQFVIAIQFWLCAFTAGNITIGSKKGVANGLDGTILYAFFKRLYFFVPIGVVSLLVSGYFYFFTSQAIFGILLAIISLYITVGYLPQVSYPEFLVAKKDFRELSFWQLATGILIPFLSMIAAVVSKDIVIFSGVQFGLITIISTIAFLRTLRKYNAWDSYGRGEIDRSCYHYGIALIPSEIILTTSTQLSSFIIGPLFGFASLATYSVASRIETSIRAFLRLPYNLFYADFARHDLGSLADKIRKNIAPFFAIAILASIGAGLIGIIYIHFFLPQDYSAAALYFVILSLGFPAFIMQSILRTALEATLRHKEINKLTLIVNFTKIALIILLGSVFKVTGIVASAVILTWAEFILYYHIVLSKNRYRNNGTLAR